MWVSRVGVRLWLGGLLALQVGGTASDLWQAVKQWVFPTVTSEPLPRPQCLDGTCNTTNVNESDTAVNNALQTSENISLGEDIFSTMATGNVTVLEDSNWNSAIDANTRMRLNDTENAVVESEYSDSNYTSEYSTKVNTENSTESEKVRARRSVTSTTDHSSTDHRWINDDSSTHCVTKGLILINVTNNVTMIKGNHIGDNLTESQSVKRGELIGSKAQTDVNNTDTQATIESYNGLDGNVTQSSPQKDTNVTDEWAMSNLTDCNDTIGTISMNYREDVTRSGDLIANNPSQGLKMEHIITEGKTVTLDELFKANFTVETHSLVNTSIESSIEASSVSPNMTFLADNLFQNENVTLKYESVGDHTIKGMLLSTEDGNMKHVGTKSELDFVTNSSKELNTVDENSDWNTSLPIDMNKGMEKITDTESDVAEPIKQAATIADIHSELQVKPAVVNNGERNASAPQSKQVAY